MQICVVNTFLLIDVSGQRLGPFGGVAFGVVAFGVVAFGVVAFGVVAFGVVAFGVVAFGVALAVVCGVALAVVCGVALAVVCGVAFGGGAIGDAEGVEVLAELGFVGAGTLLSVTVGLVGVKPGSDLMFTGFNSTLAKAALIGTPSSDFKLKASGAFSTFGTKMPFTSVIRTTLPLLSKPTLCFIEDKVNVEVSDFVSIGLTDMVGVFDATLLVD